MTMQQASVLDLGIYAQAADHPRRAWLGGWKSRVSGLLMMLALAAALYSGSGAVAGYIASLGGQGEPVVRLSFEQLRKVEGMTVDDKSQIVAEGAVAEERNAAIPVSGLPLENVRQFLLSGVEANTYGNALKCLTQAVYYEAANEPLQGRQAVAQVILNRMRHPAYPKSVCGVVYQGSERRTGCQFSFTCDGSLLRTPMAIRWREAAAIARAALAGFVETSVGTATHYHADYVLPKWAFQLAKIEQIGRHIFYRFPGAWGKAVAFNGRYSQTELLPQLDYAALRLRADEAGMAVPEGLLNPQFVPGLTVEPSLNDRHAPADVGGRLDMTKTWRLNIPDPVAASSRYRAVIGDAPEARQEAGASAAVAAAASEPAAEQP